MTSPTEPPAVPEVVALVQASSTEVVQDVQARFAGGGFIAHPASGPTFAIEAPVARFEEAFGVTPAPAPDGGWTTDAGDELPLDRLPAELRDQVGSVSLERPAELHGPDIQEQDP